ncbi:hypothetical protein ACWKWU_04760 [Chitinophaga lutea]
MTTSVKLLFLASSLLAASCDKAQIFNPDGPGKTPGSTLTTPAHGDLKSIVVTGSGSKTDYNAGNYTFAGHRHMAFRSTDFDSVTTAVPATNTKAGWQAHLSGIYPILTSNDFNSQATASGATLELTGGPTHSGKWLKRQLSAAIKAAYPSNYRLRNWNLLDNTGYKPYLYVSFYLQTFDADDTGKYFRMYWKRDLPSTDPKYSSSFWTGKPVNTAFTWRVEWSGNGELGGYGDERQPVDGKWNRIELMFDFDNDIYQTFVNGKLQTDSSRNYFGPVSGQLGLNSVINYALLGNTVDPMVEDGHHLGWALPYVDYSSKRIELADTNNWATKTKSVVQPVKSWSGGNVEFIVNQGDFADLNNKHIFYVDGTTATYIGTL